MKYIKSTKLISDLVKKYKENDKTVGLIVGGFDILHIGHIHLFRFAKKHVNILIVGLDHDKTLTNTKGITRPINKFNRRKEFLSELISVDHVFKINKIFAHGDEKSFIDIANIFKMIMPTHMFSSIYCDSLWKEKRDLANSLGIKFVPDKGRPIMHSSEIIKKIESEI